MAGFPRTSENQARDDLLSSEGRLLGNAAKANAEARRVSRDSIKRLEHIIAIQEARIKKMRHQSQETLRLRAFMKDLLITSKLTLLQIRQSAEHLEISWAMLGG
jgi:hypothetical protein